MLGERLRELRKQRWMDQGEVAKGTGIDQATISRIEHDKRSPTHEQLILLAKFFGVSLDYLTGVSDDATPRSAVKIDPSPVLPRIQLPVYVEYPSERVAYLSPSPEAFADAFYTQVADDLEHYFYVRVMSEAMIGIGIMPGSLVLVHAQSIVENGEVAICQFASGEVQFRKVWLLPEQIMLIPAHPGKGEALYTRDAVTIVGRVVQIITDLP